ncbi:MAG: hypothetical protein KC441_00265 [Anaerolineales bacterium]|nr:hypothetical protein [Anaerolineales bacterium]
MNQPDFAGAVAYALARLKTDIPPKFTYHTIWHTQEDVLPASLQIAQHSGVSEAELRLIEVAAAFHDIGFTEVYASHELAGVRVAAQVLPEYDFASRDIEVILGMIMATRLPQSPRNLLEEIVADADLDVLGRPDFFVRNALLQQEWANFGHEMPPRLWYEGQLAFMRHHTYFTPAARMLRNHLKKQHILAIEEKLRSLH